MRSWTIWQHLAHSIARFSLKTRHLQTLAHMLPHSSETAAARAHRIRVSCHSLTCHAEQSASSRWQWSSKVGADRVKLATPVLTVGISSWVNLMLCIALDWPCKMPSTAVSVTPPCCATQLLIMCVYCVQAVSSPQDHCCLLLAVFVTAHGPEAGTSAPACASLCANQCSSHRHICDRKGKKTADMCTWSTGHFSADVIA